MPDARRTVARAMSESLYGPAGLYRRLAPRQVFSTSATSSPLHAEAVLELAHRVVAGLGAGPFAVVDVGAGDGALLAGLAARAPASWQLIAVDLRARPAELPARVGWQLPPPRWWTAGLPQQPGPELVGLRGLVVAHELLDDVPVGVHRRTAAGWVELGEDGAVTAGATAAAAVWLDRWCARAAEGGEADGSDEPDDAPGAEPIAGVESGERRDALWGAIVGSLEAGAALAVDYAVPAGATGGTLRAYAGGRLVPLRFDGSVQVTAGVRFDALAAAGEAAGATSTVQLRQREALPALVAASGSAAAGSTGARAAPAAGPTSTAAGPSPAAAGATPAAARPASAADLTRRAELAHLRDPDGLGAHRWLLQGIGLDAGRLLRPLNTDD